MSYKNEAISIQGSGVERTVTIEVDSAKSVTLLLGTGFLQIIIIKKCSVAVLFL